MSKSAVRRKQGHRGMEELGIFPRGAGRMAVMVGAWPTHGGRVDITSNTWWARLWTRSSSYFGIFRVDSDLGASSKIAAHMMIYKTH